MDNIGVFRCPASGVCTWIVDSIGVTGISTIVPVSAFSPSDAQYSFGLTGDTPVIGNWSGTGQKRIGIFRPNSPIVGLVQWFVDTNGDHTFTPAFDQIFAYGLAGDQPVVVSLPTKFLSCHFETRRIFKWRLFVLDYSFTASMAKKMCGRGNGENRDANRAARLIAINIAVPSDPIGTVQGNPTNVIMFLSSSVGSAVSINNLRDDVFE